VHTKIHRAGQTYKLCTERSFFVPNMETSLWTELRTAPVDSQKNQAHKRCLQQGRSTVSLRQIHGVLSSGGGSSGGGFLANLKTLSVEPPYLKGPLFDGELAIHSSRMRQEDWRPDRVSGYPQALPHDLQRSRQPRCRSSK
jgi:hypothetical protein